MRKPRVDRSERREEISGLRRRLAFSQTALRLCAEECSAAQEEFLLRVLESEAANREEVRKARYLREAGFPVYKTLEGVNGRAKLTPCGHRKITPLSIFRTLRPRALG